MNCLQKTDRLVVKLTGGRYLITDVDPEGGRIRLYNEETNRDEYFLLDDVRNSVANGVMKAEPAFGDLNHLQLLGGLEK